MELLSKNWDRTIRIPMRLEIKRSLNLSNSVNIILYEALRQLDFPGIG
jgi:tRNA (cytidine/uridine-2'-O-)-methyltransferase